MIFFFFFFNDTATTEIYTLSLHDALPISHRRDQLECLIRYTARGAVSLERLEQDANGDLVSTFTHPWSDRKSTRLNSSHSQISYAVFCLKKKTASRVRRPHHVLPTHDMSS